MDLIKLQQKAILVPTPGQTEQEYLGTYLHQQKFFYVARQSAFSIRESLEAIKTFPFAFPLLDMEQYKKIIHQTK